jgi:hypothetical protein
LKASLKILKEIINKIYKPSHFQSMSLNNFLTGLDFNVSSIASYHESIPSNQSHAQF